MVDKLKTRSRATSGGFIQLVFIVITALIILKYAFEVDIVGFLTSGKVKDWLDKLYAFGLAGWNKYKEIITAGWTWWSDLYKKIFN
jgi:hypothetical protein